MRFIEERTEDSMVFNDAIQPITSNSSDQHSTIFLCVNDASNQSASRGVRRYLEGVTEHGVLKEEEVGASSSE